MYKGEQTALTRRDALLLLTEHKIGIKWYMEVLL